MGLPDEYKDLPVVASVSGGKDSTALCLHLQEQGIEYRAVHMDTGWEHPATDEYIREVLEPRIGPIEWIRGPLLMRELILKKGMFPGRINRWCTDFLKVKPFWAWLDDHYSGNVVNAVGIRDEESKKRAGQPEWEETYFGHVWHPLKRWTVQDVVDIHSRNNVLPNPLYLKPGISRVGCWPCIYATKAEVGAVAHLTPERIDEIRELEAQVEVLARARAEKAGTTLEEKGHSPPTFFTLSGKGSKMMPIDEAVKWARTQHGGKHYELFYDPDRSGCLRWGMCDV